MICFLDRTFCSAKCRNDTCSRQFTDELHERARKWWEHDPNNAPIAFSDFSRTCKEYLP